MKFSILIISILFLTTSCYDQGSKTYHFDWATVDSRLIESELLKIAKIQNPYPNEINIERSKLRNDTSKLSSQIGSLTRMARDKCLPEGIRTSPKIASNMEAMPPPTPLSSKDIIGITTRNTCIKNIGSDPLVKDLKVKLEQLQNISKKQSMHDSRLRDSARKHTDLLISQYSSDKFELVIKNNKQNILYNKSGLSIDITDAILNDIKSQEPQILID